jgi:hypothetical protein
MKAGVLLAVGLSAVALARQQAVQPPVVPPVWVAVRPIAPPATPLPTEAASATVTKFSFFAYGDTKTSFVSDDAITWTVLSGVDQAGYCNDAIKSRARLIRAGILSASVLVLAVLAIRCPLFYFSAHT